MKLATLEVVTEENFDPARYLAANADVLEACRRDRYFSPAQHFAAFGKAERRLQLNRALPAMMQRKYVRFRPLLAADDYGRLSGAESFPLIAPGVQPDPADRYRESTNYSPAVWIDQLNGDPDGFYLDLGCGLRPVVFDNCLYIEVYPSLTADIIVAPNTRLPLRDASLDGLCCLAVLEHVEDPFFVATEIKRVVKPGGRIFIDWPFLQPLHGFPSHYYNATIFGLRHAFEDAFEIESLEAISSQGADYTLSWILGCFIEGLPDGPLRQRLLGMTVAELRAEPADGDFYRACMAAMRPETKMQLACGNTLIGRRRSSILAPDRAALTAVPPGPRHP